MITQDNIFRHELIGLHATVVESANSQLIGIAGLVIDETKSMLKLDTQSGIKMVPKDINEWKFNMAAKGQDMYVDGTKIAKRSAERLITKA